MKEGKTIKGGQNAVPDGKLVRPPKPGGNSESCPICGGHQFLTFRPLLPLPYETKYGVCTRCHVAAKESEKYTQAVAAAVRRFATMYEGCNQGYGSANVQRSDIVQILRDLAKEIERGE